MTRPLWDFPGGLALAGNKAVSTAQPVAPARLPKRIVLALHQHIGSPAEPLVAIGDHVLKGQKIARAADFVSVPVHASTSGRVVDIGDHPVPHPSGLAAPSIVIEPDGEEQWRYRRNRITDYTALSPSELRNRIREAGIVGLGGAAFPTHVKLNPGPDASVETLIINGVECEPYITCDDMLMREHADQVIAGSEIMRHVLGARHTLLAIEDDKPEAAAAIRQGLSAHGNETMTLVEVPTRYPAGGEKQLIQVLTGKEVPIDALPQDIGIVCQNVATAVAVYKAVAWSEPLISRYVTVTGDGVAAPRVLEVLVGTPIADLVEQCGGFRPAVDRLVMGGSMMGFALATDQAPVVKATNCLLAMTPAAAPSAQPAMPCIRCGECAEVCPAGLLPQQLYWHARVRNFDEAQAYHLFECIECGCCAYVCPSHIPLVQYYRFAKTEIWAAERERRKAELARQRYEFRLERLEREERERAERRERKKARAETSDDRSQKKRTIDDAVARARAKRAARGRVPADAATTPGDEDADETAPGGGGQRGGEGPDEGGPDEGTDRD